MAATTLEEVVAILTSGVALRLSEFAERCGLSEDKLIDVILVMDRRKEFRRVRRPGGRWSWVRLRPRKRIDWELDSTPPAARHAHARLARLLRSSEEVGRVAADWLERRKQLHASAQEEPKLAEDFLVKQLSRPVTPGDIAQFWLEVDGEPESG